VDKLTDDDLGDCGAQDQFIGRIQERYGIAKDEARRQGSAWLGRMERVVRPVPGGIRREPFGFSRVGPLISSQPVIEENMAWAAQRSCGFWEFPFPSFS
jgi:hypothetical protein